jgi:hypothetical protein
MVCSGGADGRLLMRYLPRRRFRTRTEATRIDRKLAGAVDGQISYEEYR